MQLARLVYGIHSASPAGKLVQIARALELELCYTKRTILEAYLNFVPYGGHLAGPAAASLQVVPQPTNQPAVPDALAPPLLPDDPPRPSAAARRRPTHST